MDYNEYAQNSREVILRCKEQESTSLEVSRDFILPDSYADIKRILSVTASLAPTNAYCEGHRAYYGGEVNCRVIFVSEEGSVHGIPFTLDYEGSLTLGPAEGVYHAAFLPALESVSARSVNPRKIGIRARLDTGLYTWESRNAQVAFPGTLTPLDLESFEEKTENAAYLSFLYCSACGIESGDDIAFDLPFGGIDEILATNIVFSDITAETREDALAVNAVANIDILYRKTNGEGEEKAVFASRQHRIALSTLVECEGAREGDAAVACLYIEKTVCRPSENEVGEKQIAELDFSYCVYAAVAQKDEVALTKDLYSTAYECDNIEGELRLSRFIGQRTLSARVSSDMSVGDKGEVIASNAVIRGVTLVKDENGYGNLKGLLAVTMLLQNEEGSLFSDSVELSFSAESGFSIDSPCEYFLSAYPERLKITAKEGGVLLEASLTLSFLLWQNVKERAIVSSSAVAPCEKRDGDAFTVYFPSADEDAWAIAKKYRVRESDLILSGNAKGRGKEARRALILPQKKKALFSGVIN